MHNIDINEIMEQCNVNSILDHAFKDSTAPKRLIRRAMKEAILTALKIASEKACTTCGPYGENSEREVDKQSILDVEKFIK